MSGYSNNSIEDGASDMDSVQGDRDDELPDGPPSIDTIFSLLAHPHRRYALDCLRNHRAVTLADLADEVAVRQHEQPLAEIPAESVKEIYLSLYHTHVPKLEAANLVEYDQTGDSVSVDEAIDRVTPFLALADDVAV